MTVTGFFLFRSLLYFTASVFQLVFRIILLIGKYLLYITTLSYCQQVILSQQVIVNTALVLWKHINEVQITNATITVRKSDYLTFVIDSLLNLIAKTQLDSDMCTTWSISELRKFCVYVFLVLMVLGAFLYEKFIL